jgi:hypothetical protein
MLVAVLHPAHCLRLVLTAGDERGNDFAIG